MEIMERILKEYEDHDFSNFYHGSLKFVEKGLRKEKFWDWSHTHRISKLIYKHWLIIFTQFFYIKMRTARWNLEEIFEIIEKDDLYLE